MFSFCRKHWAEYFDSIDIRVAFWSAMKETEKLEQTRASEMADEEDENVEEDSDSDWTDDDAEDEIEDTPSERTDATEKQTAQTDEALQDDDEDKTTSQSDVTEACAECGLDSGARVKNSSSLLDGEELIAYLRALHDWQSNEKQLTTIGLVTSLNCHHFAELIGHRVFFGSAFSPDWISKRGQKLHNQRTPADQESSGFGNSGTHQAFSGMVLLLVSVTC